MDKDQDINPGIRKSRVLSELLGYVIPGCHDHSLDIYHTRKNNTIPTGVMILTIWASSIILKNQSKIRHGVVISEIKRFGSHKQFFKSEVFINKVVVEDTPMVRFVIETAMDKRNFVPIVKLIKKKQYEAALVLLKIKGDVNE